MIRFVGAALCLCVSITLWNHFSLKQEQSKVNTLLIVLGKPFHWHEDPNGQMLQQDVLSAPCFFHLSLLFLGRWILQELVLDKFDWFRRLVQRLAPGRQQNSQLRDLCVNRVKSRGNSFMWAGRWALAVLDTWNETRGFFQVATHGSWEVRTFSTDYRLLSTACASGASQHFLGTPLAN